MLFPVPDVAKREPVPPTWALDSATLLAGGGSGNPYVMTWPDSGQLWTPRPSVMRANVFPYFELRWCDLVIFVTFGQEESEIDARGFLFFSFLFWQYQRWNSGPHTC
jgi:hypothetical protein